MIDKKTYNRIMFQQVKTFLLAEPSISEARKARISLKSNERLFIYNREEMERFLTSYIERKEVKKQIEIKPFQEWKGLIFDIKEKDIEYVESRISKINNPKLKFEFDGILNLIKDSRNLVYNPLYTRKQIIKDLKKFKSLNYFKVSFINPTDLKKEYSFLAVKKDCQKGHSKIYRINHGLYVLRTVNHDDITLKVFYIFNNVKTLLKRKGIQRMPLKDEKFNLSSTEAWKYLNKTDNIIYYGYCNRNGLDKSNRELLKSIRKMAGKKPAYDAIADAEEAIDKIETSLDEYYSSNEVTLSVSELVHREWELESLKDFVSSFGEENNSLPSFTPIEDYGVPYWKENKL